MTTALPPPAIVQPAAYEVSYGLVTGTAPPGTQRLLVRAGSRLLAGRPLGGRHFTVRVQLPLHETSVFVVAVSADGRRSTARVDHVLGLPRAGAPVARAPRLDPRLAAEIRRLTAGFAGSAAVYVQSLADGRGAAWNARARFPAGSTLKLAIAVAVLSRTGELPPPDSYVGRLLRQMLVVSDNDAANALEVWLAGSTGAGGRVVDVLMRSLGLDDTIMYGGYLHGTSLGSEIPLQAVDQPALTLGKRTSARDLAWLLRDVWLASGGRGALRTRFPGFSAGDARHLLYLLAHVRDRGKIDRQIGEAPGIRVLHKGGWINAARHDNALVFWRGGVFVVTVMTYRAAGAGRSSDVLAGRVAATALRRFAHVAT